MVVAENFLVNHKTHPDKNQLECRKLLPLKSNTYVILISETNAFLMVIFEIRDEKLPLDHLKHE